MIMKTEFIETDTSICFVGVEGHLSSLEATSAINTAYPAYRILGSVYGFNPSKHELSITQARFDGLRIKHKIHDSNFLHSPFFYVVVKKV
jgi:hypothetical protein